MIIIAKKKKNTIELDISELKEGTNKIISNIGGNIVLSESSKEISENLNRSIELAAYDFDKTNHLYARYLETENSTYVTDFDELLELAKNPQSDIAKIQKINSITQYYVNKDDIIGKVMEVIENNVNKNYSLVFPKLIDGEITDEEKAEMIDIIDRFHKQIDIEEFILNNVIYTYLEGNYIPYLRGSVNDGWVVECYPLGILEISDFIIDGEPIVTFDVDNLKKQIGKVQNKFSKLKSKEAKDLSKTVEEEILKNYPEEVGSALKVKDKIAILNPQRLGVNRINNFRGKYGVTPILKALNAQLLLDTYDAVDRKNAMAKAKKIYHQKLRADLLKDKDGKLRTKFTTEIGQAHGLLLSAMSKNTVILTTPPTVESLDIIEPKTTETKPENILLNRNRVLNALGIGFLSNESKSSYNTVTVNVSELLKTINKISQRIEPIMNKFYKVLMADNGKDIAKAPSFSIQSTEYLDYESKAKLVDLLYNKLGVSYETIFKTLGKEFDLNTEVRNRLKENAYVVDGVEYNLDRDVFVPYATSFNSSGNELGGDKNNDENDDGDDKGNKDMDKKIKDKEAYEQKKKLSK